MKGNLLWLDMEMTGLDPGVDRVLEIAAVVTDWDFAEIASFETGVYQARDEIEPLLDINPLYIKLPQNKKELLALAAKSPSEAEADVAIVTFVRQHCDTSKPVLLAGNSIHQDRRFIRHYYPQLEALLHYRMLDVSAWKVVVEGKFNKRYIKKDVHRALHDVRESIAELEYYLSELKTK